MPSILGYSLLLSHSRSSEPTRIAPPPDFLLTFYSNHLVPFPGSMVISVENCIFPFHRVFNAPAEGVPLGIEYRQRRSKTRMMDYRAEKEV